MNTLLPLISVPLIGSIVIGMLRMETEREKEVGKQVALLTSIITLMESLRIWWLFDNSTSEFQLISKLNWIRDVPYLNLETNNIIIGIDGISLWFIILTTLLIPICILASWDSIKILIKQYLICFLMLEFLLIGVFIVLDIFWFYILFEGVLIPMYIIIGVWGSRAEKVSAAYYFFFYTLIGSVLMLIGILYIYSISGTTDYITLLSYKIDSETQKWIFLAFFASLAVKIPKFPFHIWLPQAHVEAPVAGSVILAGILIKLGGYGFIRYTLPILPEASKYFTPLIFTLGVIAVIYASLTTLRQTDLKRIIAYSSVSHMGVVTLGLFTLSAIGISGSIFLQIAHGLVSSALFIIVTVLYDRHHTRLVKYYRGIAVTMPIYSTMFLFFTLANIAVPLSCNFVGEFLCLAATYEVNTFIAVLSSFGIVLSACYGLFLFNRVCFGSMSIYIAHHLHSHPSSEAAGHDHLTNGREHIINNRDLNRREFFVLFPLAIFTLLLGVFPNVILDTLHPSVINLTTYL